MHRREAVVWAWAAVAVGGAEASRDGSAYAWAEASGGKPRTAIICVLYKEYLTCVHALSGMFMTMV